MLGDAQFVPIKFVVSIDLLLFRVCLSEYFYYHFFEFYSRWNHIIRSINVLGLLRCLNSFFDVICKTLHIPLIMISKWNVKNKYLLDQI